MISYTHKIQLMNGETILITQKQANEVKEAIIKGSEWIPIGEELINAKSIGKIGFHHATGYEKKIDENMIEIQLQKEGRFDLVDAKRKLVQDKTIGHAIERDRKFMDKVKEGDPIALKAYYNIPDQITEKPQTEEETMRGEPAYYINENGEKIYS
jgi:hypothetical protein